MEPKPPAPPHQPRCSAEHESRQLSQISSDDLVIGACCGNHVLAGQAFEYNEFQDCLFQSTNLSRSSWMQCRIVDTIFTDSDLANVRFTRCALHRAQIKRCRMTGIDLGGIKLEHCGFDSTIADLGNIKFASLNRCRFESCNLSTSDFGNATIKDCVLIDCDLTRTDFSHAQLINVWFDRCRFDGLQGVTHLRGAIIRPINLLELSAQFAAALGISLSDEPLN